MKPVTEIYQQHLIQHVNFHKIFFNSLCILFFYQKRKNGLANNVPIFNNIRSTAYHRRSSVLPPIPKTLEDIVISDRLKLLENGEPFVILDNPVPYRLIALCSPRALISLSMFQMH